MIFIWAEKTPKSYFQGHKPPIGNWEDFWDWHRDMIFFPAGDRYNIYNRQPQKNNNDNFWIDRDPPLRTSVRPSVRWQNLIFDDAPIPGKIVVALPDKSLKIITGTQPKTFEEPLPVKKDSLFETRGLTSIMLKQFT